MSAYSFVSFRFVVANPLALLGVLALWAAPGCGDDASDAVPDGGGPPPDSDAPRIVATFPVNGEVNVSTTTLLLLTFDEAMSPQSGAIRVEPGDLVLPAAEANWFDDDRRVAFDPGPLGEGERFEVTPDGFVDAAGNALEDEDAFFFTTLDERAPRIVASAPTQGATGVSARDLSTIRLVFDEPMDTSKGFVSLQGGPGRLGAAAWEDDRTVAWPLDCSTGAHDACDTRLRYETTYELFLNDFRDRAGNRFDDRTYVVDGALRFHVGADLDPPFVAGSTPLEGAMSVPPEALDEESALVTLRFVESMDATVTEATLSVDGEDAIVEGRWNEESDDLPARVELTFDLSGRLGAARAFRLDLDPFPHADATGNPLDGVTYLGDGALDFATGPDGDPPYVETSRPEEGATGVDVGPLAPEIVFNEPMGTSVESVEVAVTVAGVTDVHDAAIVWSTDARSFRVDATRFRANGVHRVDVRGFADAAGNPVDVEDVYLVDGFLDFETGPPSGETCRDPLTIAEAALEDGVYEWTLTSENARGGDGAGATCAASASSVGEDAYIRYENTSGNVVRAIVENLDTFPDINVEVFKDACLPGEGSPSTVHCERDRDDPVAVYLDQGPGTYFIALSDDSRTTSWPDEVRVRIDEVPSVAEGESCAAPLTTSSDVYEAPVAEDDPHRWVIPPERVLAYDRSPAMGDDGTPTCETDGVTGNDAVVHFRRATTESILEVTVSRIATTDSLGVAVGSTCDPSDAGHVELACGAPTTATQRFVVGGPGLDTYVWVYQDDPADRFPGARVAIREILPVPGEACSNPLPLAAGTTSLALSPTDERFNEGSCFDGGGGVTWYEVTPTDDVLVVRADGSGGVVLRDATTLGELGCRDAVDTLAVAALATGRPVCVGVERGGSATQLTVESIAYDGIAGTIVDPGFRRAVDAATGDEVTWTTDSWMAVSPTTVYLGSDSGDGAVFEIAKIDGARAVRRGPVDGLSTSVLGEAGLAVGEVLFALSDSTSASSRVFRLWDARSAPWSPVEWDTGFPAYPSDPPSFLAYDGTELVYAFDDFTSAEFYRVAVDEPSEPVSVGGSTVLEDVRGVAADDTYLYVLGQADLPGRNDLEGLFRVRRDRVADGTAIEVVASGMDIEVSLNAPVFLDDPTDPAYLYFRTDVGTTNPPGLRRNSVHVVKDPGGEALWLGAIVDLGTSDDHAMAYDADAGALYLFETETTSVGRIVRID